MKKLASFAMASALVFGLAACSSSNEKTSTSTDKDSITLAVWGSSPSETEGLEKTVESFEKEKNIEVNIEVIQDNFQDALTARFAAKNPPDVFNMEAFAAPKFIKSGVLEDITEDVENQDDFYQPVLDAFKDPDGKLYAVPKDYSTLAMYVNTDMLSKAGYSVEDVPKDWKGLVKFAEELQKKLAKDQAAVIFDATFARNMSSLIASGLNPVTEDNLADFTSSKEAISFLKSIVDGNKEGYLKNPQIDLGMDSAGAAFGLNKAAIMIEGNWVLSALRQDYSDVNYQVMPAPTVNGKEQSMTFTVGYAIAKDTKKKEAAIEFVNYMTGEGQKQWSEISGTFPTRQSIAKEMDIESEDVLKAHIAGASYGTVWSSGINLPVIATAFDNQFIAAINGDKSVDQAMKDAEKEANSEIERQQ
ncbi:ABC transporter substrate-binding protein [Niallia sp. NCCP-28]|uniref:sugar ABC transporter substrate-binding protein n=1 Tax=Niallia sp. NCCP-28 TaxID=2934712 RepID=UPI00208D28F6|nr:ABC transporter substrate-binding protein [Niallia sp. NCCP-28]GKU83588.1 ABC transporter substrate-binding protein [Niallia sp. NCCP-28]